MKLVYAVRLEPEDEEHVRTWAQALGVSKGEYVRELIHRDRIKRATDSSAHLGEWEELRCKLLSSEPVIAVLELLRSSPNLRNLKEIAVRSGLENAVVREVIRNLHRSGVLTKDERGKYEWTYQAVFVLPEYTPVSTESDSVIGGSVSSAFARLLGDYDEFVSFVATHLEYSQEEADVAAKGILSFYAEWLTWLRESVFPIVGRPSLDEISFFRGMALRFLADILQLYAERGTSQTDFTGRIETLELVSKVLNWRLKNLRGNS